MASAGSSAPVADNEDLQDVVSLDGKSDDGGDLQTAAEYDAFIRQQAEEVAKEEVSARGCARYTHVIVA